LRIFHITTNTELQDARRRGEYEPAAFARDGFIHCSYGHQVAAVANRLFGGRADLVLLEIDPRKLSCAVIDENLEGGTELYPHIYGRLPMASIVTEHPLVAGDDGRFSFDDGR
jgi:uncharacterized protein (DUF952 family)